MDVHHHAHTSRRKWTHYFWEFLMLFLAVFCGFLAEYQLEHLIEKNRAKQYIHSYEDLKTDTSRINEMLLYDDDKITALRGMEACYDSMYTNPSSKCVETIILHSRANRSFTITDRTITQLAYVHSRTQANMLPPVKRLYTRFIVFNRTRGFVGFAHSTDQIKFKQLKKAHSKFKKWRICTNKIIFMMSSRTSPSSCLIKL